MRIKELSERTSVSRRLLRYYEEQGLLQPQREENGYRAYDELQVARVEQIRSLLNAGLTTEVIRDVLPCLAEAAEARYPAADFVSRVQAERQRMAERLECLTQNLRALDNYLSSLVDSSGEETSHRDDYATGQGQPTALRV